MIRGKEIRNMIKLRVLILVTDMLTIGIGIIAGYAIKCALL